MAGRSSRSFIEEGRLEDIKNQIREGDYLLIQFGHNDAAEGKPERYVAVPDFPKYLEFYVKTAREKGAVPVLLSPVCLCPCEENQEGEKGEIARQLPAYRDAMKRFAEKEEIIFVDMYRLTEEFCEKAGEAEARKFYIKDLVHLSEKGADQYARILADHLKSIIIEKNVEV